MDDFKNYRDDLLGKNSSRKRVIGKPADVTPKPKQEVPEQDYDDDLFILRGDCL
jgi:hypothetical protein